MSRVFLYDIARTCNTYNLYECYMKKAPQIRKNIRLLLLCLASYSLSFPKDIWGVLLNKIHPNRKGSDQISHIIDMPCATMRTQEDFIDGLTTCLENEIVFSRNPLLCTDADPFESGIMLQYGTNCFLSYPALFAKFRVVSPMNGINAGTNSSRQPYQLFPISELFLGVETRGKWPTVCWVNGVELTEFKEILLSSVYAKNISKTDANNVAPLYTKLLYFPQLGPLIVNRSEPMVIEVPKTHAISFRCAFGVYSPQIQHFFTVKNKKHKTQ